MVYGQICISRVQNLTNDTEAIYEVLSLVWLHPVVNECAVGDLT